MQNQDQGPAHARRARRAGRIAAAGVFSAFSSQTDNPGNVVTAGTVSSSETTAARRSTA